MAIKKINSIKKKESKYLSKEYGIPQLCAKDAMIKPVLIYVEDSADSILKKLKKEHINACIVVTKDKKFLGEIGVNDIIKLFLQQVNYEPLVQVLNVGYKREFMYKSVKEMINIHKSFVRKDTPINHIIKLIWDECFEYIPVLDEKDKVVGVITPSSIINLLKDY